MWPDGRKYDGDYVDDQKEGFGIYFWPDGKRYEGQWSDGKQHGEGKILNAKGKCRKGIWEEGNRIQWVDGSSRREQKSSNNPTLQGNTFVADTDSKLWSISE